MALLTALAYVTSSGEIEVIELRLSHDSWPETALQVRQARRNQAQVLVYYLR